MNTKIINWILWLNEEFILLQTLFFKFSALKKIVYVFTQIAAQAILSLIAILGYVVMDDGGQLFAYAVITWIFSAILLWKNRLDIPILNLYLSK